MESFILDWLSLVLRWLHLIAGIAWIGASFYFIWLDNSLTQPPQWKKDRGIAGELWAIHGGGIYEVGKYALAPKEMPAQLHWFKWEAYATWISGSLLLIAIYYFRADFYLVGQNKWLQQPAWAIACSLLFLMAGLLVYEILLKYLAQRSTLLFSSLLCAFIALSCWLAVQLFSDRAAFLHVGALMATIMAANVFLGIIPAQKAFVQAVEAGSEPAKAPMLRAKTRSVHNNYFTLPVLFCMISNHYAFVYGQHYNWLILIAILAISAYARHFFNLRHRGVIKPQILLLAVLALLVLMAFMYLDQQRRQLATGSIDAPLSEQPATSGEASSGDAGRLMALTQKHCGGCHAKHPTNAGFSAAPAGIILESVDDLRSAKQKVATAMSTRYMPLANMTGMTEEERAEYLNLLMALE